MKWRVCWMKLMVTIEVVNEMRVICILIIYIKDESLFLK